MMRNKAFILTFNRNSKIGTDAFHDKLINIKGILNWWKYIKSTYILIVGEHVTATNISEIITKIAPKSDFLVVEVNLKNHNGWLPQEAWDWIDKQNKNINKENPLF